MLVAGGLEITQTRMHRFAEIENQTIKQAFTPFLYRIIDLTTIAQSVPVHLFYPLAISTLSIVPPLFFPLEWQKKKKTNTVLAPNSERKQER